MKKATKSRIQRILEKHCVLQPAQFFKCSYDEFGDIAGTEKYAEYDLYFSQLLHRYNPYIDLRVDDDNSVHRRRTPMAILPYDEPLEISENDIIVTDGKEYTITFFEDIKGYYYLLSLQPKQ